MKKPVQTFAPDVDGHNSARLNNNGGMVNAEAFIPAVDSRPAKRRKRSTTTSRQSRPAISRRKGKLSSALQTLPTEIIHQICSNLVPTDLLHLAQSSKIFALFLLSHSAAVIWKASRLLLSDFPDCPVSLSEQQFAVLIFGNTCQKCGKAGVRCIAGGYNLRWTLRRRWCVNCRAEIVLGKDPDYTCLGAPWLSTDLIEDILDILPIEIMERQPHTHMHCGTVRVVRSSALWETQQYIKEVNGDAQGLEVIRQKHLDVLKEIHETEKEVTRWLRSRESIRRKELDALRVLRQGDLKARLIEDGYDENVICSFTELDWDDFPTIDLPKRLGPKGYRTLKPKIDDHVRRTIDKVKQRAKRLAEFVLKPVYEQKIVSLETGQPLFHPPFLSVFSHPDMQDPLDAWVMENVYILSKPRASNIEVSAHLLDMMHSVMLQARAALREHLLSILPSPWPYNDVDPLALAVSVFASQSSTGFWSSSQVAYFSADSLWSSNSSVWSKHPWPLRDQLTFNSSASHIIANIVQGCGLDVSTCTYPVLGRRDPYVACLRCCNGDISQSQEMMRWQQAPFHWEEEHSDAPAESSSWWIVEDKERAVALSCQTATGPDRFEYRGVSYCCLLCGSQGKHSPRLLPDHLTHVQQTHGSSAIIANINIQEITIQCPERWAVCSLEWNTPVFQAHADTLTRAL